MKTTARERAISLEAMLQHAHATREQKLEAFAVLNLGIIQSLWSGVLNSDRAIERFYNAENCLYVRRQIKDATCDEIMSRGVLLGDLLEILPPAESQRAFAQELDTIRALSLKLLSTNARRSTNGRSKRSLVPPHA
jgi:hypothetical protein